MVMKSLSRRRGTVLVVALGILAILAIVGTTMIKVARVDNLAARNFRYSADLDFAVDSALEWVEYKLVSDYWLKEEGEYYHRIGRRQRSPIPRTERWLGGHFDNPNDPMVPIALINPKSGNGRVQGTTDVADGGLYVTSDMTSGGQPIYYDAGYNRQDRWYNLPLAVITPPPGENLPNHIADGGLMYDWEDRITLVVSGNRRVEVSVTVLDLSARYNLNFHGGSVTNGSTNCAQSYLDDGAYPTCVNYFWADTTASFPTRSPIERRDTQSNYRQAALDRYGSDGAPELPDQQINFFSFSNKANDDAQSVGAMPYAVDVPYGLDDLFELLHLNGTLASTRVERLLPYSLARTGEEQPDSRMYRKSLFTTHSWVSAVRHRQADEAYDKMYPKADLNNVPDDTPAPAGATQEQQEDAMKKNPLRMAWIAAGLSSSPLHTELNQIVANMLDFADDDADSRGNDHCKPRAIELSGGDVVFGQEYQPFLNEVFIDLANAKTSTETINGETKTYKTYPVYVELANPYKKELMRNEAYTKVTYGPSRTQISGNDLPEKIKSGGPLNTQTTGEVIDFTVKVEASTDPRDAVFPVELYTNARTLHSASPKTHEIIIDRFPKSESSTVAAGKSDQRLTCTGKDRSGSQITFFGGWDSRADQRSQTCIGDLDGGGLGPRYGDNVADAFGGRKIARPIENRSKTPKFTDKKRGRYTADEMSFKRIGDVVRVLRIGPIPATDSDGQPNAAKTVPERLAAETDASVKKLYVDITDRKYRMITNFVTVGSPYYDNVDNDGDQFVDEQDSSDTTMEPQPPLRHNQVCDNLGPELYEQARINLKTAQPEVIRGLLPAELKNSGARTFALQDSVLWNMAEEICRYAQAKENNDVDPRRVKVRMPADILDMPASFAGKRLDDLFVGDGCDDDGNGAVDDWAEQTWLYGYMSNWVSTRSDCFVVYGTVRLVTEGGRVEGIRHFMSVLDRVPATAFRPFSTPPKTNVSRPDATTPGELNDRYTGMRRVMLTWID